MLKLERKEEIDALATTINGKGRFSHGEKKEHQVRQGGEEKTKG